MQPYDVVIVGGGIVGLASAWALQQRRPGLRLLVVEKERAWARHQTGRNSGVIHSGIYYQPGSLKARMGRAGNEQMVSFCRRYGVGYEVCGKLIVATSESELPGLERLHARGLEHGLEVRRLDAAAVRDREPHVRCAGGLEVPSTGTVNFRAVCERLAALLTEGGAVLETGCELVGVRRRGGEVVLETTLGERATGWWVNCAGLQSDRVARLDGLRPAARIVPFRGEYYELVRERCGLVKGLVYPVPNPAFPFLGVHFTRMIDGSVHAGPNAVLALKREGYSRAAFSLRDTWDTLGYAGFWRLAGANWAEGWRELRRSWSKRVFVQSLQTLVPEVEVGDLVPGEPGVRAQALLPDGRLVDDFLLERGEHSIHVLNAPSPAATASLEIGGQIAAWVLQGVG